MNKIRVFLLSILFVLLVLFIKYFIENTNELNKDTIILNKLFQLQSKNQSLISFVKLNSSYINFDIVVKQVNSIKNDLNILEKKASSNFKDDIILLKKVFSKEFKLIEKYKSYNAVLSNSLLYLYKNKDDKYIKEKLFDFLINYHIYFKFQDILKDNISYNNNIKHIKILYKYNKKLQNIYKEIDKLNINKSISNIIFKYNNYSINFSKSSKKVLFLIGITILIILLIIIYILTKETKEKKLLYRFKKAVENNFNVVLVTDLNMIIKYVNDSFCKIYGYNKNEVIGKHISIIKSGYHNSKYYKNIKQTIFNKKPWYGEFVNKAKDGKLIYEKTSITPILDEKGNIIEFLSIKLDITKDKEYQKQLIEQERILLHQSKMASMGEMIGNIAHQWRQPLSVISTIATSMELQASMDMLNNEDIIQNSKSIHNSVQYLSKTIDDFRNFYKQDKEKENFSSKEIIDTILDIVNEFQSYNIKIIKDINDNEIYTYKNELIQALLNIFNNAKDAMIDKDYKYIFIKVYKEDFYVIFEIKDSGGGIPENIKDKIFEPYFTTKHQSQGTGIGLYMTYEIIRKHLKGSIEVKNIEYNYDNIDLKGALFRIKVPIK